MPETTIGPDYYLASVGQTGIEHCPDGSTFEWLAVRPTLGWTSTSGPAEADLDPLMGKPVVARGAVTPAPERPPLPVEPKMCPQMQMRSDWVSTPRGIKVRRTEPLGLGHFRVDEVRRLDEITVAPDPDDAEQLRVRFANPLPFALTGVRLRLHYEGCYGKPGSTRRESEAVDLAPGEALEHAFPRIDLVDHPGPRKGGSSREHVPAAVVIEIAGSEAPAGSKLWAELEVSLAELGVKFECP